jgi:hypothetical protein
MAGRRTRHLADRSRLTAAALCPRLLPAMPTASARSLGPWGADRFLTDDAGCPRRFRRSLRGCPVLLGGRPPTGCEGSARESLTKLDPRRSGPRGWLGYHQAARAAVYELRRRRPKCSLPGDARRPPELKCLPSTRPPSHRGLPGPAVLTRQSASTVRSVAPATQHSAGPHFGRCCCCRPLGAAAVSCLDVS